MGLISIDERRLNAELEALRLAIISWAKKHHLWHDAQFKIPFQHNKDRPRAGEIMLLTFDGPLYSLFNGHFDSSKLENQFYKLIKRHGFYYELEDHTTMNFICLDEARADQYLKLQRWEWTKHLLKERLIDIRAEVFEHFASAPDDLKKIEWRQFELLLDAIFRNQGFRTELGSGSNDGGVDLRLYQSEGLPELVTLVQAKRYANRPIQLEAVAALFGVTVAENANSGLFVTSSRFQPKAKAFATATEKRIGLPRLALADGPKVAEWCNSIAKDLNDYFANGAISQLPQAEPTDLTGKIVVARSGYGIILNYFCVIEADFAREVVLRPITTRSVSGDSQVGEEVPCPDKSSQNEKFVAFKKHSEYGGELTFWGDRHLFAIWDGKPRYYNWMD